MKNKLAVDESQKFVIIETGRGGREIHGSTSVEWHKEIVAEVLEKGVDVVKVLGGGWIKIDSQNSVIYVWGRSTKYGDFSFDLCVQLLQQSYDYQVKNEVPSGEAH